jgi:AcrR family transcriptional regulator
MAPAVAAVNTLVYGRAMTDRLTKSDWIRHGLATLAKDGANALKVGPMADGLKVSRGSFYWHFEDIADFRAQLLQSWQEQACDRVIETSKPEDRPDRLKQLMRAASKRSLDRTIRSWAAEDRAVAAIVARSTPGGSPTSRKC